MQAVQKLVYASNLLTQQRNSKSESDIDDTLSLRPASDLGADELHVSNKIY